MSNPTGDALVSEGITETQLYAISEKKCNVEGSQRNTDGTLTSKNDVLGMEPAIHPSKKPLNKKFD